MIFLIDKVSYIITAPYIELHKSARLRGHKVSQRQQIQTRLSLPRLYDPASLGRDWRSRDRSGFYCAARAS